MRAVVLVAVVFLFAGCNGGTVDKHALTNDAATIDSINCEAWLLARATGDGRATAQFSGEQAEELHVQAANLADALGKRQTTVGLEERVRAKARVAAVAARRLQRLQRDPGDRALAARLADLFRGAGNCS